VLSFWQQNGAQIMAFAQSAWGQVQAIIGNIANIIATIVTSVFGGIASFINTHGAEIQQVLSSAWTLIQGTIQLALDLIQGITTTALGILTGDWDKTGQGIQQIVSSLGTFVSEQFNNLKGLIEGLGPGFISAAGAIGQGIIDGIKNGISNGVGAIIDAAKRAAQSALDAAKRALGIASPSTKFYDQVGGESITGWVDRLKEGKTEVAGAVQVVAQEALKVAQTTFNAPFADQAASVGKAMTTGATSDTKAQTIVNVGGMSVQQAPGERGDQFANEAARRLLNLAASRR
jgi:phage-related protein